MSFTTAKKHSIGGAFGIACLLLVATAPAHTQEDLPPIAAPTSGVSVGSLPVIRTESQQVTDYVQGLMKGLMAREDITAGAIVVVSQDRVDMAEGFGAGVDENFSFALGSQSDLFGTLLIMQLIERMTLRPTDEIADIAEGSEPHGTTLEDVLIERQTGESRLIPDIVEHASGNEFGPLLSKNLLTPLGMTRTRLTGEGSEVQTTAADMGQLLLALVNRGEANGTRILDEPTADLMMRTQDFPHRGLPGRTLGFAEMLHNGWRALQRDGGSSDPPGTQSRLVIIPEAGRAYFTLIQGQASARFWRAFDNALFDRLAPPRIVPDEGPPPDTLPRMQSAAELAGTYHSVESESSIVRLKSVPGALHVRSMEGTLILTGAENLTLHPVEGGYWRSEMAQIPAAFVDGVLHVGDRVYRPTPVLVSSSAYLAALLVLGLVALSAAAAGLYARSVGSLRAGITRDRAFGVAGIAALFAFAAAVLHGAA